MKTSMLLAIDDRPDNLHILQSLVAEHLPDCQLLTAASGNEGLAAARENELDGALVDMQMPGMNGIEMCRRLKRDERTARVPVLLMTAHRANAQLKADGLEAGADDFLSKPVDNLELIAKIKVMLRIKQAEDKLREANATLEQKVAERTRSLSESEERYRRITEAVTDYIYTVRVEAGQPVETTHGEACFAVTGYSAGEFETNPQLWIQMVAEEDREKVLHQASRILAGDDAAPIVHRIVHKDGAVRWVNSALVPIAAPTAPCSPTMA